MVITSTSYSGEPISSVGDFGLDDEELAEAVAALGFTFGHDDVLADMAQRMAHPIQ